MEYNFSNTFLKLPGFKFTNDYISRYLYVSDPFANSIYIKDDTVKSIVKERDFSKRAYEYGWESSWPDAGRRYDIILKHAETNVCVAIQIKTIVYHPKTNICTMDVRCCRDGVKRPYKPGEIDYLVGWTPFVFRENNDFKRVFYIFPLSLVLPYKREITIPITKVNSDLGKNAKLHNINNYFEDWASIDEALSKKSN